MKIEESSIVYTPEDKIKLQKLAGVVLGLLLVWRCAPLITPIIPHFFVGAVLASSLYATIYKPLVHFLRSRKFKIFRKGKKTAIAMMLAVWTLFCFSMIVGFGMYGVNKIDTGIEAVRSGDNTMITELQEEAIELLENVKGKYKWSTIYVDKAIEMANSDVGSVTALLQGGGMIGKISQSLIGAVTGTLAKVTKVFMDITITIGAIILFLLRGKKIVECIIPWISFFGEDATREILQDVQIIMNNLVKTMISVGLGQGLLATAIVALYCYFYAPISIAVLVLIGIAAVATSACGFPLVATPAMCILIGVSLWQHHYGATGALIVALVVVTSSDNIIKLRLLGSSKKRSLLSALALMFCMVSGVNAYGIRGLMEGPFLIALLVAIIIAFRKDLTITKCSDGREDKEIITETA